MSVLEWGQEEPDSGEAVSPLGADPDYLHSARLKDGAAFILDTPAEVPCVWGRGQDVVWAGGESLILVGPPGVGKTTIAGQLARARLGLASEVLGMPVAPGRRRVLLLGMDRPAQLARALRRNFTEADRDVLRDRLRVWQGPPPADLAKDTTLLLALATAFDADTIIVDSLKDAAIGLTDDETAAGYNRARQRALAEGVELLELHHQVKRGANGGKPTTLADVYGSAWITAGAGSVILLHGDAGDPIVDFRHLKQPAAEVGPHRLIHDHVAGMSEIYEPTDLLMLAKASGSSGLTARAAASAVFGVDHPTASHVEKARRKLEALTRVGSLVRVDSHGPSRPTTYLVAGLELSGDPHVYPHGTLFDREGSRPSDDPTAEDESAGSGGHGTPHDPHAPRPSRMSLPLKGADVRSEGPETDRTDQIETEAPAAPTLPEPASEPGGQHALDLDAIVGPLCPLCNFRGSHSTACLHFEPPAVEA